jgi:hypothetical protein
MHQSQLEAIAQAVCKRQERYVEEAAYVGRLVAQSCAKDAG